MVEDEITQENSPSERVYLFRQKCNDLMINYKNSC